MSFSIADSSASRGGWRSSRPERTARIRITTSRPGSAPPALPQVQPTRPLLSALLFGNLTVCIQICQSPVVETGEDLACSETEDAEAPEQTRFLWHGGLKMDRVLAARRSQKRRPPSATRRRAHLALALPGEAEESARSQRPKSPNRPCFQCDQGKETRSAKLRQSAKGFEAMVPRASRL
jgi:hypothetical protein